jgi:hypothetical protein
MKVEKCTLMQVLRKCPSTGVWIDINGISCSEVLLNHKRNAVLIHVYNVDEFDNVPNEKASYKRSHKACEIIRICYFKPLN